MMTEEQKQALIKHNIAKINSITPQFMKEVLPGVKRHLHCEIDSAKLALYSLGTALTQPATPALKLPDAQEQVIGVWNPSANEIAVRKLSGIKIVDFAHWHCHCTKEVVIRDISDHPAILNASHTAPIEPICATGGAEWVKCSERMPDEEGKDGRILVCCGGEVKTGFYDFLSKFSDADGYPLFSEVTHWMPIPAAPEEK